MDPQVEASIPKSIRDQFQRDDEGRLLWFTAASRDRSALNGVAPEYAGLGHSISHLAHIADVREERRRKRKERDEKIAAEEEAKRRSTGAEKRDEEQRRSEEAREAAQSALLEWASEIEKGTKVIEEGLGDWRDEKKVWDEERRAVKATGTSTE
jgi:chromatin structure-remodeling complex subunit RSC1/2